MYKAIREQKNGRREFPTGVREVYAHAQSLGGQYCGTIVPDAGFESEECRQWAQIFDSLKRPSVWFDRKDRFNRNLCGTHAVICRGDEREFVRTGIEGLHMLGHRKIWYGYDPGVSWQQRRSEDLREIAETLSPAPHVIAEDILADRAVDCIDGFKNRLNVYAATKDAILRDRIHAFLTFTAEKKLRAPELLRQNPEMDTFSYFQKLLSARTLNSPWYEDVSTIFRLGTWDRAVNSMLESKSTAVIMPNDGTARLFYNCLLLRNVRIPSDISLVGYDNAERRRVYPISSVDRGYLKLGYWAFHAIMGDIPTPVDKKGFLFAAPFLRNAGSLDTLRTEKPSIP